MPIHALVRPLPPGDPRAWLSRAALSRPAQAPPHVVLAGTDAACLAVGLADPDPGGIAAADGALLDQGDVRWVGGHGVAVLAVDGRPALLSYARLRFRNGSWWCRTWLRLPGMAPDPDGGDDHAGLGPPVPPGLRPLLPVPVPGAVVERKIATAPAVRPPAPDLTLELPEGAGFPDAVHAAAHRLEARFVDTGRAQPALVAWTGDGVEAWVGDGRAATGQLHGWGRARSADPDVRALGLFGLGEDELDGRRVPMVALAMQARGGGSVLWLRRFERLADGRARWLDPVGLVRSPGPDLGLFAEAG